MLGVRDAQVEKRGPVWEVMVKATIVTPARATLGTMLMRVRLPSNADLSREQYGRYRGRSLVTLIKNLLKK